MTNRNNNLREELEEIAERERQPACCVDCGADDYLGPLHDLGPNGEVRWICDTCRDTPLDPFVLDAEQQTGPTLEDFVTGDDDG